MPANVKIEGSEDLMKAIEQMGLEGSKIANDALRKAGEYLVDEMKRETPVRTGKLRDSIEHSNIKTKDNVKYIEVGPNKTTNWRAKYLEFGTKKMKANPFMSRAYEKNKDKVQEIIADKLKEGLGLK